MFREFLLLIRQCAGDDGTVFVQPVKGCAEFALLRFIHGELVLFQPSAFRLSFGRAGILTADVRQFGIAKTRILFNRPQRVGCLDRSMLVRVAGQDDPALDSSGSSRAVPAFVARRFARPRPPGRPRPRGMEILREKSTDGLCAGKAVPFQIGDLLALRCEDLNGMTGFE